MEVLKALAMILLAAAAISATGGLVGHFWPASPQQTIGHFDQPVAVVKPCAVTIRQSLVLAWTAPLGG